MRARTAAMFCPSTRMVPASGGMMPSIMRSVVVLPAPLGPRKPRMLPRAREKLEIVHGGEIAEAFGDMREFEKRLRSQGAWVRVLNPA